MTNQPELTTAGEMYVRRRWIPAYTVAYAEQAQAMLYEHGCVRGDVVYARKHQARWQVRRLRDLLVECRMFPSEELTEHTERKFDGWIWSLEHKPRGI